MTQYISVILIVISFLWIVMGSTHIAKFFQKIKLPLITGFLFAGIVAGPFLLKLVERDTLFHLNFINEASLAYIAFAAGAELYLKEIRNNLKSIMWNTLGQLVVTFSFGAIAVFLLSDYIPFMQEYSMPVRWAISIMSATFFVARSPSSIIAVIKELKAKGPFTKMAIGVTIIKDVLVIILFAICLSVSNTLVHGENFSLLFILELLLELGLTFIFGYLLSLILKFVYSFKLTGSVKLALVLIIGYLVFPFADEFQYLTGKFLNLELLVEPLLICIIAGFWMVNYTKFRLDFVKNMETAGPYVFAIFFTLIGAGMSLDVLLVVWKVALVFFAIRLVGLILGNIVGGSLARDPKIFRFIGWMPFITQAGVGLAFAMIISETFPGWGEKLATIIIGVIVINQFIGDILFKWAVRRVGESHELGVFNSNISKNIIIFGYENQSVALSVELLSQNWRVSMVTSMEREMVSVPEGVNVIFLDSIKKMDEHVLESLELYNYDTYVLMFSDEINLRVNEFIYENCGKRAVIVRLQSHSYLNNFTELGSQVIDPATALVNLLHHFIKAPQATSLLLGMESGKDTLDIELRDATLHGISLRNLSLPSDVLVLSVQRNKQLLISHGYTRLRKGDILTLVGSPDSLEELRIRFEV